MPSPPNSTFFHFSSCENNDKQDQWLKMKLQNADKVFFACLFACFSCFWLCRVLLQSFASTLLHLESQPVWSFGSRAPFLSPNSYHRRTISLQEQRLWQSPLNSSSEQPLFLFFFHDWHCSLLWTCNIVCISILLTQIRRHNVNPHLQPVLSKFKHIENDNHLNSCFQ